MAPLSRQRTGRTCEQVFGRHNDWRWAGVAVTDLQCVGASFTTKTRRPCLRAYCTCIRLKKNALQNLGLGSDFHVYVNGKCARHTVNMYLNFPRMKLPCPLRDDRTRSQHFPGAVHRFRQSHHRVRAAWGLLIPNSSHLVCISSFHIQGEVCN